MSLNNQNIIYLDSSSIIRNIPPIQLCKILTRKNFEKNYNKLEELIDKFNSPYEKSYKNELFRYLNSQKLYSLITMDCSLEGNNNSYPDILNLFGTFNSSTISSLVFFDEEVSFEKYKQSYFLIKNAHAIIYDTNFNKLSIGKHLINTAHKSNSFCITPNAFKNINEFTCEMDNIITHCRTISLNKL